MMTSSRDAGRDSDRLEPPLDAKWHSRLLKLLPSNVKAELALCNPTALSTHVCCYVARFDKPQRRRREFVRELTRNLRRSLTAAVKAKKICISQLGESAKKTELDQVIDLLTQELQKVAALRNERRLGVNDPIWILAVIEAYIARATGTTPPPRLLCRLIRAGRTASGQRPHVWDTPEIIAKNLRNFKKRPENAGLLQLMATLVSRIPVRPAVSNRKQETKTTV